MLTRRLHSSDFDTSKCVRARAFVARDETGSPRPKCVSLTDLTCDVPSLVAMLLHLVQATAAAATAVAGLAAGDIGETFGNGLAGLDICQGPRNASGPVDTVILNHTLGRTSTHGVLDHFWITGNHGPGQIDEAWISYFVDGEAEPSIEFQASRMCGQFFPELMNESALYSAGPLCGRNSNVGGWFNTFPIPFGRSVIVTARPSARWVSKYGCLHSYISVRGTENTPLTLPLSGVTLPPTARLQLQRHEWTERQPLEYVNVTSNRAGQKGVVFMVSFAVEAKPEGGTSVGGAYIEGCWQFYRQRAEPFPGLVVGTGLEDYFDSAFCELPAETL
eukprot:COSAG02_NODE_8570_length_2520_cov_6.279637_3_plen_333_part_00